MVCQPDCQGDQASYDNLPALQGWRGLAGELGEDTRRLWSRNLGRDDRLVADTGREARHPFLAEEVVETILGTPLPLVADLRLPPGASRSSCPAPGHSTCGVSALRCNRPGSDNVSMTSGQA